MIKHLESLRKRGKHQTYGALPAAACAGTWTQARKRQEFNSGDETCERGQIEDDFHRIWGACS
eukprot:3920153-Pyramimonas_sp.AAC.1